MKVFRVAFLSCLLLALFVIPSFSEDVVHMTDEELDYAEIVNRIQGLGAPYLDGDNVIFTYPNTVRYVGIAFEFENFQTIHNFSVKRFYDAEYEESGSLCFYVLELPKHLETVNYRLVVDGLWTTDPQNSSTVYSDKASIKLSHFDASRFIPRVTEQRDDGIVHFVYQGAANLKVRLAGSFTNWDSWIYVMKETSPGFYELNLNLPPGRYEYAYYTGITSFPDRGNPERVYTNEGKTASLLIVN